MAPFHFTEAIRSALAEGTPDEFFRYYRENKPEDWRLGQSAFNYLRAVRPDLADEVLSTRADPFDEDSALPAFEEYIRARWSTSPPPRVGIFDETAKWFLIPGRNGAKGLYVAINPEGAVGIRPADEALGSGWGLYPEAAADLRAILDAACSSPGTTPSELAIDVSRLQEEGWFALADGFEASATEGGSDD